MSNRSDICIERTLVDPTEFGIALERGYAPVVPEVASLLCHSGNFVGVPKPVILNITPGERIKVHIIAAASACWGCEAMPIAGGATFTLRSASDVARIITLCVPASAHANAKTNAGQGTSAGTTRTRGVSPDEITISTWVSVNYPRLLRREE